MSKAKKIATVDDVIEMMLKLTEDGLGDYKVVCNYEYWLAMKGDKPEIHYDKKFISLGGYDA